jgi:hypothetical protein
MLQITQVFTALDAIATDFKRAAAGALDPVALAEFADEMVERITENLLVRYLECFHQLTWQFLSFFTIIEYDLAEVSVGAESQHVLRRRLYFEKIGLLFSNPLALFKEAYGWGTDSFDGKRLFAQTAGLANALGLLSDNVTANDGTAVFDLFAVTFAPTPKTNALPSGIEGTLYVDLAESTEITIAQLSDTSRVALRLPGTFGAGLVFRLLPPTKVEVDGGATVVGDVSLSLVSNASDSTHPLVLFGAANGSRLQAKSVQASLVVGLRWAAQTNKATGDIGFEARFQEGKLSINTSDADDFLHAILPADGITVGFDFGLGWTPERGFYFSGGSDLEVRLPMHLELGPVALEALTVVANLEPRKFPISFGADIRTALGPIVAVVENMGLTATFSFPPANSGNLGPFQFDLRFKPPSGVGLSVDAQGVVTGGGFLLHDEGQQIYAGVMQLSLQDHITLNAFGLIATQMPDGSRGYSLIIFITAEDFEPIPLGLGFTLQGIGGMIAINRTFDQDALRAGMKNDTLKSLLFPRDPVGNAPVIIRSLASAFPAQRGSYLLGILAKIGWFTPALIELDLALILEFGARERLLVLGRISSLLPSADNDLVRINLDAMGVLDFDQDTAAVDAVLVDSRLVQKYALTGKAALRADWHSAESTDFVLSIGGFNPRFAPPAGVPPLERVAIALSSGTNPRLTCDAYFAITSNTIQFGAEAQLYAEAYGFSISGDVGYDVLIARAPLHFIADFHASVQLKHGSDNLFKVSVEGALEGPQPLRLSGKASFEIFWCDFTVRFDTTLVTGEPPPLPPAVDVLAQLEAALSTAQSWSTQLAPNRTHGVALRKLALGSGLVLDPLGQLAVNESVVPLDTGRDIDSFGGAPVAGARRFTLSVALNGVALTDTQALQARFAPAQFFAMSDDEELASPSFVTMDSGLVVGTDAVSFDPHPDQLVAAPVEYQPITIDPLAATPPPPGSYTLPASRLALHSGAAARAPLRRLGRARFRSAAPPAVSLAPPRWVIVPLDGGSPVPVDRSVKTWTDYRAVLAALNRGAAGFQLVPATALVA